jgi:hypothetical protein
MFQIVGFLMYERFGFLMYERFGLLMYERFGFLMYERFGLLMYERFGLLMYERFGFLMYELLVSVFGLVFEFISLGLCGSSLIKLYYHPPSILTSAPPLIASPAARLRDSLLRCFAGSFLRRLFYSFDS